MAVVAGVVPWCLQVAPLDPSSGPDSGPGKNVGGSESGSRTVVRMHSCSMVVAVDYIHTHTHNGWKGAQWVSVKEIAFLDIFDSYLLLLRRLVYAQVISVTSLGINPREKMIASKRGSSEMSRDSVKQDID